MLVVIFGYKPNQQKAGLQFYVISTRLPGLKIKYRGEILYIGVNFGKVFWGRYVKSHHLSIQN